MSTDAPIRVWFLASLLVLVLVPACIAYVDRPLADFVHARVDGSPLSSIVAHALLPVRGVAVLAPLALFVAGTLRLAGRPSLPSWAALPLRLSWSLAFAVSATVVLKHAFGRSALDPYYLQHGTYTFRWLGSSWGYDSFPSGTTAVAATLLATQWLEDRRRLGLRALLLVAVSSAVVLAEGHWLSDVIAGAFLGVVVSAQTHALLAGDRPSSPGPATATT